MTNRLFDWIRAAGVEGLLAVAGYGDEERHAYSEVTFRLVEERWFSVEDGFPRLTADVFADGVVPHGLGNFRYTLDLDAVTEALPPHPRPQSTTGSPSWSNESLLGSASPIPGWGRSRPKES